MGLGYTTNPEVKPRREGKMQQWEYLFIGQAPPASFTMLVSLATFVNWEQVQKMSRPAFVQYCNELGAKGWEMVTCNNDQGTLFLAFKRPTVKPETGQQ
jgi:hypothetical protein